MGRSWKERGAPLAAATILAAGAAAPASAAPWWKRKERCSAVDPDGRETPTRIGNAELGWFLAPDRLRLYVDTEEALPGITAADVRPGGTVTALLAALSSLLGEQRLTTTDTDDPHCSRVVDLTDW